MDFLFQSFQNVTNAYPQIYNRGEKEDQLNGNCSLQGNETAKRLAEDDKAEKVPKELYNHYTVILFETSTQTYRHVANATFFKEEVSAIVAAFDRWIAGELLLKPQLLSSTHTYSLDTREVLWAGIFVERDGSSVTKVGFATH